MKPITSIVVAVVAAVVTVLVAVPFLPTATKVVQQTFGSTASPDIQSPYYSVGGMRAWRQRSDSLVQATTTVCAIQSPPATSTLMFASLKLSVSSTTASTVTVAKAATAFATSTLMGTASVSANAQATVVVSTTTPVLTSTIVVDPIITFAPSQYLVFGMAGGTGNFSPTGDCEASWLEN